MYESRYALLKKAFVRFQKNLPEDFAAFCEKEKEWLDEYTLFMALKDANDGNAWAEWDKDLRTRKPEALDKARVDYAEDIEFYKMLQYLFFKQWRQLKAYANENGIEIIGDVPIYVASDSADVWANPKQFYLDEDLNPIEVAGCPPDAFSADGQLWGNPLFRWDVMKKMIMHGGPSVFRRWHSCMILSESIISADLILTMQFRQRIRQQRTVNGKKVREWICSILWRRNLESFRLL